MKLAIVGGRDFNDYEYMEQTMLNILIGNKLRIAEVVSGGARGADTLAERFARHWNKSFKVFPADWNTHGNRAGYLRNEQIVQYCDLCVAFWDGKSRGTKLTIDLCKRYGKKCFVCTYGETPNQPSLFG